ncbi:MAG TPA: alpha/beta hydrolase [Acidimicrobiales bacterium]|nr:alpha/beta hydrolase [Acidimicrobiales bacterium]
MGIAHRDGVDIYFEEHGPADGPPLLLVNGFTSQVVAWEQEFVDEFVAAGFRLITFDNRDVGLSTKTDGPAPALGETPPYTVADMASDGMAVLDALGIDRAHVVGASMGGMIVQRMAIDHPDRVLSLTSIMSTTGDRTVGAPNPEAMTALITPPPTEREAYLDQTAANWRIFSGPHYDEARSRARGARSYDRMFHPKGAAFQMAAIMADGDRTAALANVRCPTLVIHGRVDPLVGLSGGEATAAAIPGAELLVLDEMGHDVPLPLIPEIVGAIAKVAARA